MDKNGIKISTDFPGGNIRVISIEDERVNLVPDLRDTDGDWFYWAFCVEGAEGRKVTFDLSPTKYVGRFGPAVSHDLESWSWLGSEEDDQRFTYSFKADENRVYFAHDILYQPTRFDKFCAEKGLKSETFCVSRKGSELPCVRLGRGDKKIILTARHHCCESTGSYVLESVLSCLADEMIEGCEVLAVPFIDYDGVVAGDQGKNRIPHDHNRDYTEKPIYPSVKRLMESVSACDESYFLDFHSPWHMYEDNDRLYICRSTQAGEAATDSFARFLMEETKKRGIDYDIAYDIRPGVKWNNPQSAASSKYFSLLPGNKLSISLETPYFGLEGNVTCEKRMSDIGSSIYCALVKYIASLESKRG